jgi:hypothetical protein
VSGIAAVGIVVSGDTRKNAACAVETGLDAVALRPDIAAPDDREVVRQLIERDHCGVPGQRILPIPYLRRRALRA